VETFVKILTLKNLQTVDAIKQSIISDYNTFVKRLEKGYRDDNQHIINKIIYVDTCEHLGDQK
jgi:hypothetical protein